MEETTYLVVDGENIDATLGLSVLDRRPNPEERPRWDRVLEGAHNQWGQRAKGLFFLNGSSRRSRRWTTRSSRCRAPRT